MFNIRKNKTLSLQYKKRKFPNSNVYCTGILFLYSIMRCFVLGLFKNRHNLNKGPTNIEKYALKRIDSSLSKMRNK
jgi:hypothetical protein